MVACRATLRYYPRMNADSQVVGDRLPDEQATLIVEVFRMLADACLLYTSDAADDVAGV